MWEESDWTQGLDNSGWRKAMHWIPTEDHDGACLDPCKDLESSRVMHSDFIRRVVWKNPVFSGFSIIGLLNYPKITLFPTLASTRMTSRWGVWLPWPMLMMSILALSAWRTRRLLTSCRWTEPLWSFLAFRNDIMNYESWFQWLIWNKNDRT